MNPNESISTVAKPVLKELTVLLLRIYKDPEVVDVILHEALHEAFREVLKEPEPEQPYEIPYPVLVVEPEPRSLAAALNYQSTTIHALWHMSCFIQDTGSRTLAQAEMSLKGKCLFCNGNLQMEVKQQADGTKKVYLSCRKQGKPECKDFVWEIGDAKPVQR